MTNPVNNPPPLLPTTVELCTLCLQYVIAYTFQLYRVKKKEFYLQVVERSNQKS